MTHNETVDFLTTFERFQPAYAKWRQQEAANLAGRHGTSEQQEAREMFSSVSRTLAVVTTGEAADALGAMESGDLEIPPYGTVALVVRSYAMNDRAGRRRTASYDRDREPRYRCLTCRDSGLVEVVNPYFVEWFRPQFASYEDSVWPKFWHGAAYSEWRAKDRGPMLHSALCVCDCERTQTMRRERDLFSRGERRLRKDLLNAPACGMATYVPEKMPLLHGTSQFRRTLTDWYAEHAANSTYEVELDQRNYPG